MLKWFLQLQANGDPWRGTPMAEAIITHRLPDGRFILAADFRYPGGEDNPTHLALFLGPYQLGTQELDNVLCQSGGSVHVDYPLSFGHHQATPDDLRRAKEQATAEFIGKLPREMQDLNWFSKPDGI
jgi:hypothetical protein